MANHVNFYENHKEAYSRLHNTVVLYDGEPKRVATITNHRGDGVFRAYLAPLNYNNYPQILEIFSIIKAKYWDDPSVGTYIDAWMVSHPKEPLMRKKLNSPLFNKFRPFPLGMCNVSGETYYLERHPLRKMEQGLVGAAIVETPVKVDTPANRGFRGELGLNSVYMTSKEFEACIKGQYPDPKEALEKMQDPSVTNSAVGFDRNFALLRGPLDMLFLSYKTDVVGSIEKKEVRLGRSFPHLKEAVGDLRLFNTINVVR